MPSEELIQAGFTFAKLQPCPRCGTSIEIWESPNGKAERFNPQDHPRQPGALHMWSCGENLEEV